MSAQVQLDIFKEPQDVEKIGEELTALKESHDKVRKKLFGCQGEMMKIIMRQQEELDFLKEKMGLSCIIG